ncbi:MAG: transporter substrate-binding domain-containing protein, partial [Lachnospiraceae bacterium]|nr:transporter substrate-binding domain-containing protein [Lachnospiraceae bacterium]
GSKVEEAKADTVKVIDINLTQEEYAFGVDKDQPELLDLTNEFVAKIKEDGTLDKICEKYFSGGEPTAVKSAEVDSSKDQLIVATNAAFEPFEYMQGDSYYGIDMEIAALLAEELGKELVIQNMDFDAVCLSVGQHKCDIAMAGLTVNEERTEYVTFTDSYYEASQKLIVKGSDTAYDACKDAASVEALLNKLSASDKIGVQAGTTAQYYIEGDADWGFAGLPAECVPYKNGALAVQDMINGNINYVIIDAAPAACIVKAINEMQ